MGCPWIKVLPWYFVRVLRHHQRTRMAIKRRERQRARRDIARGLS